MDVFARIDQARRQYDVLQHPFYRRWSAGALTPRELGLYAEQYRHAVVALAEASEEVARKAAGDAKSASHAEGLRRHAEEERAHVALWDGFLQAASASAGFAGEGRREIAGHTRVGDAGGHAALQDTPASSPLEETLECSSSWAQGEDVLEHLAVLYAIEASQPEIARTKLEGLVERYGYGEEGPATEYFRVHATLDVEHAHQAKQLIRRLTSKDQAQAAAETERMVERARAACAGNWGLLDGVERHYAQRESA